MTLSLPGPPGNPEPADTALLAAPAGWPAAPAAIVYHELLGEIVTRIAPHTEADPVAILTQLLVAFGGAAGRGAFFQVEATRHHPNEFMLLVGDSSKARKGSSWDHVRRLIAALDPTIEQRILTGLSSGEGLIWAVRDPTGQDPGITDQRLLVIEPEFASVLKSSTREISTLSPTLRSAWDGRPLAILTRNAPPALPRHTPRSSATSPKTSCAATPPTSSSQTATSTASSSSPADASACYPKAASRTHSPAPASRACSPRRSNTPKQPAMSA